MSYSVVFSVSLQHPGEIVECLGRIPHSRVTLQTLPSAVLLTLLVLHHLLPEMFYLFQTDTQQPAATGGQLFLLPRHNCGHFWAT